MKTFKSTSIPKKYKSSAIAIGNFDGIHKGHQKIFKQAKIYTKKNNLKFGILTFNPLPVMFFNKKIKNHRLLSENQKQNLLKKYGIDFVVNIKFNKIFSKIAAENFIKKIIFNKINPHSLFVSNNFRFGNKRKGNVSLLRSYSNKCNYRLIKIKPLKHKGKIVSSSLIRGCLQRGDIDLAKALLSRTWSIEGTVQKGKKLGKKLGYPTCNINIKNYLLPKFGVYAVKVVIDKNIKIMNGIANLGYRPTFGGKKLLLEVNIFRFKKNLYKKKLTIYFEKFIRGEKKFNNSTNLVKQINKDIIFAKKHLKTKLIL